MYCCRSTNKFDSISLCLSVVTRKKQLPPKKEGEIDPKLIELLICAPKKDYEKISVDFGVTDFRWLLKRLNQLKKETQDEQAKVATCVQCVTTDHELYFMDFQPATRVTPRQSVKSLVVFTSVLHL